MRAYTVPLIFSKFEGLAKYSDVAPNSAAFESAINFTLGPNGIVEPNELVQFAWSMIPQDGSSTTEELPEPYSYPYPRVFVGSETTLLVYETSIYELLGPFPGNPDDYWTWTPVVPTDSSTGLDFVIPPGHGWDFADLGGSWFLFKPPGDLAEGEDGCTIFKPGLAALLGNEPQILGQKKISITTGCAYRGRLILGGFNTLPQYQPYDAAGFSDVMTNYYERSSGVQWTDVVNLQTLAGWLKPNTVWWSTIGGGDILAFFFPDIALKGLPLGEEPEHDFATAADPRRSLLFDYLARNECGWINMPSKGAIKQLLPFDTVVAVYSADSISLLQDTTGKVSSIPPTFGLRKICGFGVWDKNAAGGDSNEHIFIAKTGDLWKWKAGSRPEWIGLKSFMTHISHSGDKFLISVDESSGSRDYYISGETTSHTINTYLFSGDKLTQLTATPGVTSVVSQPRGLMAVYDPAGFDTYPTDAGYISFTTCPIDFGNRGKKVLVQLELDADLPTGASVSYYVQTKDLLASDYAMMPYNTPPNNYIDSKGIARFRYVGVDFKVGIIIAAQSGTQPYEYIRVRSLKLTYQQLDKRFKSGIEVGGVGNVS